MPFLRTGRQASPVYQDPGVQIEAVPGPSGDTWQVGATKAP